MYIFYCGLGEKKYLFPKHLVYFCSYSVKFPPKICSMFYWSVWNWVFEYTVGVRMCLCLLYNVWLDRQFPYPICSAWPNQTLMRQNLPLSQTRDPSANLPLKAKGGLEMIMFLPSSCPFPAIFNIPKHTLTSHAVHSHINTFISSELLIGLQGLSWLDD